MKATVKYPHSVDYKKKLYLPGELLPESMSKKDLERLVKKGRVEIPAEEEIIAKTPELKDMTVPKLKGVLDVLEVEYDKKAKKDELIALVEKNTAKNLKDITEPKLKGVLDVLEVEYDDKAEKDELIALVEKNTAKPSKE